MNIEYYKNNPTTFLRDYYGIELFPHQKMVVDKLWNTKNHYYFMSARQCNFGHIRLLLMLMSLKDNDVITIMSPNGNKEITKEQFIEAWINAYYKVGDKDETH